ncbi:MAG: aminoacyl-histidine dipeptidase [Clostridiales bacterium]|nr:aminoacyl-histidine dipeptidase [Clostridiales bacterium]
MQYRLSHLEPKEPLRYFEDICRIPHGSGNEKAVSEYLIQFAKDHGLAFLTDELYNVVIKKPGQHGGETAEPLAMQGHTDMVCEKNNDVDHDFVTDAIDYYVDGDKLKAKGTTLGADNAVAVCIMLGILADAELPHPPLECLFTAQEEVGLVGALHLDPAWIEARRIVNLDCGPEGSAVVGSAGGVRTDAALSVGRQPAEGEGLKIEIKGLQGGHSGGEIHKYKGNANKLMGRVLLRLLPEGIGICSIAGGSKENAIPRECVALISVPAGKQAAVEALLRGCEAEFKAELKGIDEGVEVCASPAEASACMDAASAKRLVDYLNLCPNGVQLYHLALKITVASVNMAVIKTEGDVVHICSSIRSSEESLKWEVRDRLQLLADLCGFAMTESFEYPSWAYDWVSPLRDLAKAVYEELFGGTFVTKPVHGGLECGVFKRKWPQADIIAIGPSASGAHSPDETLDIPSYARTYEFVRALVSRMCAG